MKFDGIDLKKLSLVFLIALALTVSACRSGDRNDFCLYLLEGDIPSSELSKHNLKQLAVIDPPIISREDIISYDWTTHKVELTEDAYSRVQELFSLPVKVDGIPFIVYVGDEPIYAGAFWTPLSSLSYEGVVIMQSFSKQGTTIQFSLGYPGEAAFVGEDPRTDPRIHRVLESQGKLK